MADKYRASIVTQANLFEDEHNVELLNYLPLRIIATGRFIERRLSDHLQKNYGLSLPAWLVLSALERLGSVSVRELGPVIGLDTVAVSRAVKRLSEADLIKKQEHPKDRRLVRLNITEDGRVVLRALEAQLEKLEKNLLPQLDVQERIRLGQMMSSIEEHEQSIL
ncbi:MarR family transcriptional regulator [Pseudovibrio sp. Tun.PSC04-5.I4]|uniref:MarR family winged helix-turn-helix transcriptional regulator n=1 Tax=Pseudovibrio sp. Tun.PSC04-5.I4 TaxID=1798213 RepID=UPI000886E035|nr:MarR family transcriptional regulator [Pseudovibrio sp. Tun.PSC04-5.I4]SDQ94552.1 DNA-binding transcriptional regulator, MarR family [Pseudovibrio sp. Tun.PSC04-5.I4]